MNLKYNFSIDNDYSTFEYNDLNASFSINNIITNFNFIEVQIMLVTQMYLKLL